MHPIPTRRLERAVLVSIALAVLLGVISPLARGDSSHGDAPPPPTDLIVTAVTVDRVSLSWRTTSNRYQFRAFVDGQQQPLSLTDKIRVLGGLATYEFGGLSCGNSYRLGVAAYDRSQDALSDVTTVIAATAACADTQPPSGVTGLRQVSADSRSMSFAWNAATDNVGVAGYRILVAGTVVASVQTTSYTYTPAIPVCGTSYQFGVQAFDATGNLSPVSVVIVQTASCGDTSPPSAPTGVKVTSSTQTGVSLAWQASTDNVGVVRYEVKTEGTTGSPTGTSYAILGLACGTSYTVTVTAVDAAGNRSASASVVAATAPCPSSGATGTGDTQPPTSPTGLLSSGATATGVVLAWTASKDNVGVAGYSVYKNNSKAGTTPVAGYQLTGLACGTGYTIGVEAYDAAGNTSPRVAAVVSTAPCADQMPPTQPDVGLMGKTDTTVSVGWQHATDNIGVVGYELSKNGAPVTQTSLSSYTFTNLTCGTTYTLGVSALDATGNKSTPGSLTVATSACTTVTAPPAPSGITVSNLSPTSLMMSWKSGGGTTTGFGVYLNGTLTTSTTATTYTFSGLTCGTSYTVGVDSYDAAGKRSSRLSLSAETLMCGATSSVSGGVYVTPGGSDASPCTQAQPCRSFGRAYKAAAAGATVYVGAGTYPGQEISDDPAKQSGPSVVFQPVGGAVTVDGTIDFGQGQFNRLGPKGVTVKDMTVKYLRSWAGSERLLWENIDAVHFDLDATDSTVRGGDYGPCQAPRDDASCLSRVLGSSRNVLVEGASFHNITSTDLANYHVDGFAVFGGQNVTLRDNRFYANMITNIRVQNCCGNPAISGLLIENNWFAPPLQGDGVSTNANGIDIDNAIPGLKIRFNSFAEGGYPQITAAQSGAELTGNLLTQVSCVSGVTYSYNVFKPWSDVQGQSACSSTDKKVSSLGYVSGGFSLSSSSPAIDYVPSSVGCPYQDLEGNARPLGAGCDAGASELR